MTTVAIATCLEQPTLTPSDALLAAALERKGARAVALPWNGPFAPFAAADIVLIRSTWDYFGVPDEFRVWLDRLRTLPRVTNDPSLMQWNMGKLYLFDLAGAGAAIAATRRIAPNAPAIRAAMADLGLDRAIVKPVIGGTASGLSLVRADDAAALEKAAGLLGGEGLVQAFIPEIATLGETSFVFIGGDFTHAVLKRPKAGDIRVQTDHGGTVERVDPLPWAIDEARRILGACPGSPAYARVDAVIRGQELLVMEVELVEPDLFFTYCPGAAARLAGLLIDGC
ncbi:MAG: RimK family alpha-L-glutamate ligase [Parvularculaceae bacterium]